ncbi:MAG: methylated-DNA--[protein]-cysteine S-methyltransferase [Prevotella sp.]|nr:methylated-DNA--[protein]-cysteine S-methyltransferase [Prevotella sp.]
MTKGRPHILTSMYTSPCGTLVLGSLGDRLCLCDWVEGKSHIHIMRRTERLTGATIVEGDSSVIDMAARQLDEYFDGRRRKFTIPMMMAGSEFQRSVWQQLQTIDYGTTVTYTHVAVRMGRPDALRAVSSAIGSNPMPIIIPCHRVIGIDNRLTGYSGGLEAKRFLLELEAGVAEGYREERR